MDIHKISALRGYGEPKEQEIPKALQLEGHGIPKSKYSTQTKKENKKMNVARYTHFGKNKTIVQNGV